MLKRLLPLALAASLALSGCGTALAGADPGTQAVAMLGYQTLGVDGPDAAPPRALVQQLGLTDAQRAQLRDLVKAYRQQRPGAADAIAEARALVLADTVDRDKLAAWLQHRREGFRASKDGRLALATRLRGVLTDAQRATLAGMLSKPPAHPAPMLAWARKHLRDRVLADLALTTGQQQAFDALVAKVEALHTGTRAAAVRQALATFVQDGDQAKLGAAVAAQAPTELPQAELVTFVASLDAGQRAKLVQKLDLLRQHAHRG